MYAEEKQQRIGHHMKFAMRVFAEFSIQKSIEKK